MVKLPHSFGYENKLSIFERFFLRYLVQKIFARDVSTINSYVNAGVAKKKINFYPDLSFYYFGRQSIFSARESAGHNKMKRKVSLSFRFDRDHNFLKRFAIKVKDVLLDYEIGFVSQVQFDNQILSDIAAVSSVKVFATYDMGMNSIGNIVDIYRGSAYVISNRLHALLLGALNGAIPIAVVDREKDSKVYEVIAQIYPDNIVILNDLPPEEVASSVSRIISEGEDFSNKRYNPSNFYSGESFFNVVEC